MRVSIYARVSSEDQAERGTIENQIEFATKYCDLHQLEIVEWYKDDGVTGTVPLDLRPEGKRILEDAKAGKFDLLLIYRLDRLGRSARIILNAVYELEQHGVKIRSMTEPFDTGDPNGRFLLTILAGVADLERETILERMWYGANRAARAGKWLGGIVPYGYRVNDEGYLEINESPLPGLEVSEAEIIRIIYRLVAEQGYSTIKAADYLNSIGIPPSYVKDERQVKRGKRKENTAGIWRPGRVRNIVVNSTYKGLHQYGKRTNKNRDIITREVPAIVSEGTWEKAQQVLRENQIEAMRNAKKQYLLRGLIKCGVCGLTYHGTSYFGRERKPLSYYICGGKTAYRGPLQGKCTSKNVPQEWIEDIIWNSCLEFINNPGQAIKEIAAAMEERKSNVAKTDEEKEMIINEIEGKEIEKQSILDLYRKKLINNADVEIQFHKIAQEKATLELRLNELNRQLETEDDLIYKSETAEKLLRSLQLKIQGEPTFEVRRQIVRTLVKEIIVNTTSDDGNRPRTTVTAKFNFVKDVVRTPVRAAITEIPLKNAPAPPSKSESTWENYQDLSWTG